MAASKPDPTPVPVHGRTLIVALCAMLGIDTDNVTNVVVSADQNGLARATVAYEVATADGRVESSQDQFQVAHA